MRFHGGDARALRCSHVLGADQTADEFSGRSQLGSLRRPDAAVDQVPAAGSTVVGPLLPYYVPGFRQSRLPLANRKPVGAFVDRTLFTFWCGRAGPAAHHQGASASQFWIDLGEVVGRVVATDGHPLQPVAGNRFPIAMAQRFDVLIDLPKTGAFPILAQLERGRRQTGIILSTPGARISQMTDSAKAAPPVDNSLEARLVAVEPLTSRSADIVHTIALAGVKPYAWSMNGEYWPQVTPLMLAKGKRVEIDLVSQYVPGDRDRWPADPRSGARHCSGHADGSRPHRVRRRQPGAMAVPLP